LGDIALPPSPRPSPLLSLFLSLSLSLPRAPGSSLSPDFLPPRFVYFCFLSVSVPRASPRRISMNRRKHCSSAYCPSFASSSEIRGSHVTLHRSDSDKGGALKAERHAARRRRARSSMQLASPHPPPPPSPSPPSLFSHRLSLIAFKRCSSCTRTAAYATGISIATSAIGTEWGLNEIMKPIVELVPARVSARFLLRQSPLSRCFQDTSCLFVCFFFFCLVFPSFIILSPAFVVLYARESGVISDVIVDISIALLMALIINLFMR